MKIEARTAPLAALPKCVGQDVASQLLDQPCTLGDRYELVRRDESALGMLPAHERLDADDPPASQLGFRLEMQHELFVLDRPS